MLVVYKWSIRVTKSIDILAQGNEKSCGDYSSFNILLTTRISITSYLCWLRD